MIIVVLLRHKTSSSKVTLAFYLIFTPILSELVTRINSQPSVWVPKDINNQCLITYQTSDYTTQRRLYRNSTTAHDSVKKRRSNWQGNCIYNVAMSHWGRKKKSRRHCYSKGGYCEDNLYYSKHFLSLITTSQIFCSPIERMSPFTTCERYDHGSSIRINDAG